MPPPSVTKLVRAGRVPGPALQHWPGGVLAFLVRLQVAFFDVEGSLQVAAVRVIGVSRSPIHRRLR